MGGLPRRASLLKQFRAEHPEAIAFQVDAGGLFDSRVPDVAAARLMWEATAAIGLDLLNLSPGDAALLARMGEPAGAGQPQLLTANVFGPGRTTLAPPYVVRRSADGTRLVFVGISEARPYGNFGYVVDEPREALARLLPLIDRRDSIVVLLAYMPGARAAQLALEVGGIDVIVSGHDDEFAVPPYQVGQVWVLQSQFEGRFVGEAGLRISPARKVQAIEPQVIAVLGSDIPDDPRIAALIERGQAMKGRDETR